MSFACALDEIPVPCEESLASLTARIGRPVAHWDQCTGRACVNPLDNLRNQVAIQMLDARVGTLYTRPKTCLTDPFQPSSPTQPDFGGLLSSPSVPTVDRPKIRANLSTPSYRGISGVSFSTSILGSGLNRVGGAMAIIGTRTGGAAWGQPGFLL